MAWTIRLVLAFAQQYLKDKGIEFPRLDAELLLAQALGLKRIDLYLDMDRPLMPEELGSYRILLKRRAEGEPIAYILGVKEFYGRTFSVNRDVLIPRPETELLVEKAVEMAPQGGCVLELGVGCGAVIISILMQRPDLVGFGNDISPRAVLVARQNSIVHGVRDRLHLFAGDGFLPIRRRFPTIVMNPPYIALIEAGGLTKDIFMYEPHTALFGGNDGLDIIQEILKEVRNHLTHEGLFIMEAGYDQQERVEEMVISQAGIRTVSWIKDLSGCFRAIVVERTDG